MSAAVDETKFVLQRNNESTGTSTPDVFFTGELSGFAQEPVVFEMVLGKSKAAMLLWDTNFWVSDRKKCT